MKLFENLQKEARQLTKTLKGKTVDVVWRHREEEVGIKFTDGTTLFIDLTPGGLDYSVTYGNCSPKRDHNKPKNMMPSMRESKK